MLYRNLSTYLREKYGKRLKKICIDGGFTCPNRDGKCGTGGCIYCGEAGAGEHIDSTADISTQVNRALANAKDDDLFIAYFQSFTNTYAPISVLKERYDTALIDERIRVLAIGTRPDCIDEDVCLLLAEYKKTHEVWVELGLQTANDTTAELINRGYRLGVFEHALRLLRKHGISVVVHIIIGLPGENLSDFKKTADYVASLDVFGVKIHSIYVMRGTKLAQMYAQKLYTPPTLDDFTEAAAYTIAKLCTKVVVHRLTGDCPRDMLIAPEWNADKNTVLTSIRSKLIKKGYRQGCLCEK